MSDNQSKHAALVAELNVAYAVLKDALIATGAEGDILIKAMDVEDAAQRLWTCACSVRRNLVSSGLAKRIAAPKRAGKVKP